PIENHFDKEILIETPLTKPGAYLVTANVENGNTTRIILWIADTAIVSKPSYEGKQIYYVADANTGKPLPKIKLDFFAYRVKYNDYKTSTRRTDIIVCRHEAQSDQEGLYVLDSRKITNTTDSFDWLCTVNTSEGRFAYLGFNDIWFTPAKVKKEKFEKELAYFITDRPVYRPKDNVHLKCWVRKVSHTETSNAKFANSKFLLEVRDPSGEKVIETQVETDRYGAFEFSWQLQKNARLGRYNISLSESHGQYIGGAYFRVEEYKKPEFEVKVVTPEKPVKLGDIIPVKISANYYFGAPVTNAKVKYKIERTEENLEWFPPRPWDWLYGNGYWWHHLRYSWLLESLDMPSIIPPPYRQKQPPELVCANEVDIGENGEVEIKIDSSIAKELFGNKNQKYQITAEITDQSRRTIVGKGAIIAAIKPLIITVWTDKGFYELGNVITANFAVQTADGKPFPCKAIVKLQKLLFNETLNPDEETILTHEVTIGENGFGELKFSASAPGQFKLLCETTTENIVCKGAIVFNVRDRNNEKNTSNANNFRYNKLELISEKPEYSIGEKARIMINSAKENATILLFLRPFSGLYSKPLCVNLNGNSTIYEFDITNEDIPNIFVEAITIYDAQVFIEKLQITVPPEKKALNVEIQPSKQTFAPDERATTKIKITELNGNPVSGNVVVTIYDKALEYISSGSNIPPIKEYFWGWKRFHEQNTQCSLFKLSRRIIKDGEKDMPEFLFSRKYFGMSYAMAGMVKDRFKSEAKLEMVSDALMPLAAKAESDGNR
ncbi:MAG: MG2 domain-containing protein, partial [Candidatus Nanoarchaeia archaeon]